MATELRCDATHALITGIDAAAGPMILNCPGYTIKVELVAWDGGGDSPDPPEHPNLRWEAVRRMIEVHTHDPIPESEQEADVIALRKDA